VDGTGSTVIFGIRGVKTWVKLEDSNILTVFPCDTLHRNV